jgi:hypothetical protein
VEVQSRSATLSSVMNSKSIPNSGSRIMGGERGTAGGLGRPPAMTRERDGGGLTSDREENSRWTALCSLVGRGYFDAERND